MQVVSRQVLMGLVAVLSSVNTILSLYTTNIYKCECCVYAVCCVPQLNKNLQHSYSLKIYIYETITWTIIDFAKLWCKRLFPEYIQKFGRTSLNFYLYACIFQKVHFSVFPSFMYCVHFLFLVSFLSFIFYSSTQRAMHTKIPLYLYCPVPAHTANKDLV